MSDWESVENVLNLNSGANLGKKKTNRKDWGENVLNTLPFNPEQKIKPKGKKQQCLANMAH